MVWSLRLDGFYIPEGWHLYYMVIDNGEGGNAPPDQFWGIVLASDVDFCGQLVPASASWTPEGRSWSIYPGCRWVNTGQ